MNNPDSIMIPSSLRNAPVCGITFTRDRFTSTWFVLQVNTLWGSFEINNVKLLKTMLTQYAR